MESILDIEISCFKNYNTPGNPVTINLLTWLTATKYKNEVDRIRSLDEKPKRDAIKAQLPCITPSGIFTYRSQKNLIAHSGLIQIDLDGIDPSDIAHYKKELSKLPEIAYLGLSASGRGLWGVIPIPPEPDSHKAYFEALLMTFDKWGIQLDDKPKNIASLRGYSCDTDAYFNHHAKLFEVKKTKVVYTPPRGTHTVNPPADYRWLLDWIIGRMESAQDGNRHSTRLDMARLTGGHIASGTLDPLAEDTLIQSYQNQYGNIDSHQVQLKEIKAIRDGITEGKNIPLPPPNSKKSIRKTLAPFSGLTGHPAKIEIEASIFIPFDEYIKGLHFENSILMTSDSYPAAWDSLNGTKYIDDKTKKFIVMAERNPVILRMANSFEFS